MGETSQVNVMNWFSLVIETLSQLKSFASIRSFSFSHYLLRKSLNTLTCPQFRSDKVAAYKCYHHRHKPHRNQSSLSIQSEDHIQRAEGGEMLSQQKSGSVEVKSHREFEKIKRHEKILLFKWSVVFIMDWGAFSSASFHLSLARPLRFILLWSMSHVSIKGIKFEWALFIHAMISDEIDKVSGVIHIERDFFCLFEECSDIPIGTWGLLFGLFFTWNHLHDVQTSYGTRVFLWRALVP